MTTRPHTHLYLPPPMEHAHLSWEMLLVLLAVFLGVVGYAFHAGYSAYSETYYMSQMEGARTLPATTD